MIKEKHNLKTLVLIDDLQETTKTALTDKGYEFMSYKQVKDIGNKNPKPFVESSAEDFFSLSFTSGTTGVPKAVMLNHLAFTSTINGMYNAEFPMDQSDCHLSYLPLSHIFERIVMHTLLSKGAEICFYSGDVLKIADDWKQYKPTLVPIVPRLLNK